MNWFDRMKSGVLTRIKREIAEGLWSKCQRCGEATYQHALERQQWICPHCGTHFAIGHRQYIDMLTDEGSFVETDPTLSTADPLKFRDHRRYTDRIKEGRKKAGMNESICTGTARIGGHAVALGVMDTRYILGSLGGATGEKICRLIDRAIADRRTVIMVCQSGGARMQESTYSLMQMAKVSARLHQLANAGLLYISVVTDPTYGGVTASFAMLGDVILAEPGARVGFAGQAVIKQFLSLDALPDQFQISEGVLEHGFVDCVVSRREMVATISRMIALLAPGSGAPSPAAAASS